MSEYELIRDEEKKGSLIEQAIALFLEQLQALTKGEIVSFTMSVSRPDAEKSSKNHPIPFILSSRNSLQWSRNTYVSRHEPEQTALQLTHILVKEQPSLKS